MRNKGFTLIELLAVIVILAIIALIATPIILGIIKDSKEESNKRNIEMYAKALENAIVKYQLNGTKLEVNSLKPILEKKGREFEGTDLKVEYDGNVVCNTIKIYEEGNIFLSNCKVNDQDVEYTYGEKQFEVGMFDSVCKIASDSTIQGYEVGAKYNCKVAPNKEPYTFHILSYNDENNIITKNKSEASSINLLMDQNINSNGTNAGIKRIEEQGDNVYNVVKWVYGEGCGQCKNTYGPITAVKFLYNVTKDWSNILPLNFIYNDREENSITNENYCYTSFTSVDGLATIYGTKNTTIGTSEYPIRTRLPLSREMPSSSNLRRILNSNLGTNTADEIFGYWTFKSDPKYYYYAYRIDSTGSSSVHSSSPYNREYTGVRPVITLQI